MYTYVFTVIYADVSIYNISSTSPIEIYKKDYNIKSSEKDATRSIEAFKV
jgi:hypothetical protein